MRLFSKYSKKNHFILWVATFVIIALRIPGCWRSGQFIWEDGLVFFADAYNMPWYASLYTPYAGYFHFLPRIFAELFSLFPIIYQPHAYGIFTLAFNAAVFSIFYFPHFDTLIQDSRIRAAVIILMALASNSEDLGLLAGMHWYLVFAMALALVMRPPVGRVGQFAMYLLAFFTAWTAPAAVVLFPFLLYKCWRGATPFVRRWALFACINLMVVGFFIIWMRFENGERTGDFILSELFVAIERLVLRGWFGCGLLGEWLAIRVIKFHAVILDLWSVFWICFFLWIVWRFRKNDRIARVTVLLGVSSLIVMMSLSRSVIIAEMGETILTQHPRYIYVATLFLTIGLWTIASEFWYEGRRRLFYFFILLQLLLLLIAAPTSFNLTHPDSTKVSGSFKLGDYVEAIRAFEDRYQKTGKPASLFIPIDVISWGPVLEKGGGFEYMPPLKLAEGLECEIDDEGYYDSWLGRFRQIPDSPMIEHERYGLLKFMGILDGRVWFMDSNDVLIFTSPLLYPSFWGMRNSESSSLEPHDGDR